MQIKMLLIRSSVNIIKFMFRFNDHTAQTLATFCFELIQHTSSAPIIFPLKTN